MVVEGQEVLERAVDGGFGSEVPTPKGDSPVFVEDGSLEPLDEAIGPTVTGLGARVMDAELRADGIEDAGRWILEEQPAATTAAVAKFL